MDTAATSARIGMKADSTSAPWLEQSKTLHHYRGPQLSPVARAAVCKSAEVTAASIGTARANNSPTTPNGERLGTAGSLEGLRLPCGKQAFHSSVVTGSPLPTPPSRPHAAGDFACTWKEGERALLRDRAATSTPLANEVVGLIVAPCCRDAEEKDAARGDGTKELWESSDRLAAGDKRDSALPCASMAAKTIGVYGTAALPSESALHSPFDSSGLVSTGPHHYVNTAANTATLGPCAHGCRDADSTRTCTRKPTTQLRAVDIGGMRFAPPPPMPPLQQQHQHLQDCDMIAQHDAIIAPSVRSTLAALVAAPTVTTAATSSSRSSVLQASGDTGDSSSSPLLRAGTTATTRTPASSVFSVDGDGAATTTAGTAGSPVRRVSLPRLLNPSALVQAWGDAWTADGVPSLTPADGEAIPILWSATQSPAQRANGCIHSSAVGAGGWSPLNARTAPIHAPPAAGPASEGPRLSPTCGPAEASQQSTPPHGESWGVALPAASMSPAVFTFTSLVSPRSQAAGGGGPSPWSPTHVASVITSPRSYSTPTALLKGRIANVRGASVSGSDVGAFSYPRQGSLGSYRRAPFRTSGQCSSLNTRSGQGPIPVRTFREGLVEHSQRASQTPSAMARATAGAASAAVSPSWSGDGDAAGVDSASFAATMDDSSMTSFLTTSHFPPKDKALTTSATRRTAASAPSALTPLDALAERRPFDETFRTSPAAAVTPSLAVADTTCIMADRFGAGEGSDRGTLHRGGEHPRVDSCSATPASAHPGKDAAFTCATVSQNGQLVAHSFSQVFALATVDERRVSTSSLSMRVGTPRVSTGIAGAPVPGHELVSPASVRAGENPRFQIASSPETREGESRSAALNDSPTQPEFSSVLSDLNSVPIMSMPHMSTTQRGAGGDRVFDHHAARRLEVESLDDRICGATRAQCSSPLLPTLPHDRLASPAPASGGVASYRSRLFDSTHWHQPSAVSATAPETSNTAVASAAAAAAAADSPTTSASPLMTTGFFSPHLSAAAVLSDSFDSSSVLLSTRSTAFAAPLLGDRSCHRAAPGSLPTWANRPLGSILTNTGSAGGVGGTHASFRRFDRSPHTVDALAGVREVRTSRNILDDDEEDEEDSFMHRSHLPLRISSAATVTVAPAVAPSHDGGLDEEDELLSYPGARRSSGRRYHRYSNTHHRRGNSSGEETTATDDDPLGLRTPVSPCPSTTAPRFEVLASGSPQSVSVANRRRIKERVRCAKSCGSLASTSRSVDVTMVRSVAANPGNRATPRQQQRKTGEERKSDDSDARRRATCSVAGTLQGAEDEPGSSSFAEDSARSQRPLLSLQIASPTTALPAAQKGRSCGQLLPARSTTVMSLTYGPPFSGSMQSRSGCALPAASAVVLATAPLRLDEAAMSVRPPPAAMGNDKEALAATTSSTAATSAPVGKPGDVNAASPSVFPPPTDTTHRHVVFDGSLHHSSEIAMAVSDESAMLLPMVYHVPAGVVSSATDTAQKDPSQRLHLDVSNTTTATSSQSSPDADVPTETVSGPLGQLRYAEHDCDVGQSSRHPPRAEPAGAQQASKSVTLGAASTARNPSRALFCGEDEDNAAHPQEQNASCGITVATFVDPTRHLDTPTPNVAVASVDQTADPQPLSSSPVFGRYFAAMPPSAVVRSVSEVSNACAAVEDRDARENAGDSEGEGLRPLQPHCACAWLLGGRSRQEDNFVVFPEVVVDISDVTGTHQHEENHTLANTSSVANGHKSANTPADALLVRRGLDTSNRSGSSAAMATHEADAEPCQQQQRRMLLVGVFDGHNGDAVSAKASRYILEHFTLAYREQFARRGRQRLRMQEVSSVFASTGTSGVECETTATADAADAASAALGDLADDLRVMSAALVQSIVHVDVTIKDELQHARNAEGGSTACIAAVYLTDRPPKKRSRRSQRQRGLLHTPLMSGAPAHLRVTPSVSASLDAIRHSMDGVPNTMYTMASSQPQTGATVLETSRMLGSRFGHCGTPPPIASTADVSSEGSERAAVKASRATTAVRFSSSRYIRTPTPLTGGCSGRSPRHRRPRSTAHTPDHRVQREAAAREDHLVLPPTTAACCGSLPDGSMQHALHNVASPSQLSHVGDSSRQGASVTAPQSERDLYDDSTSEDADEVEGADYLRLSIANLGDSRAVVGCLTDGSLLLETQDHRVGRYPSECARIIANGGTVEFNRVDGCLDVTRGLGDYRLKGEPATWWAQNCPAHSGDGECACAHEEAGHGDTASPERQQEQLPQGNVVSNIADVYEWEVCADDFLIIASDGLWDRMESRRVVEYVAEDLRRMLGGPYVTPSMPRLPAANTSWLTTGATSTNGPATVASMSLTPPSAAATSSIRGEAVPRVPSVAVRGAATAAVVSAFSVDTGVGASACTSAACSPSFVRSLAGACPSGKNARLACPPLALASSEKRQTPGLNGGGAGHYLGQAEVVPPCNSPPASSPCFFQSSQQRERLLPQQSEKASVTPEHRAWTRSAGGASASGERLAVQEPSDLRTETAFPSMVTATEAADAENAARSGEATALTTPIAASAATLATLPQALPSPSPRHPSLLRVSRGGTHLQEDVALPPAHDTMDAAQPSGSNSCVSRCDGGSCSYNMVKVLESSHKTDDPSVVTGDGAICKSVATPATGFKENKGQEASAPPLPALPKCPSVNLSAMSSSFASSGAIQEAASATEATQRRAHGSPEARRWGSCRSHSCLGYQRGLSGEISAIEGSRSRHNGRSMSHHRYRRSRRLGGSCSFDASVARLAGRSSGDAAGLDSTAAPQHLREHAKPLQEAALVIKPTDLLPCAVLTMSAVEIRPRGDEPMPCSDSEAVTAVDPRAANSMEVSNKGGGTPDLCFNGHRHEDSYDDGEAFPLPRASVDEVASVAMQSRANAGACVRNASPSALQTPKRGAFLGVAESASLHDTSEAQDFTPCGAAPDASGTCGCDMNSRALAKSSDGGTDIHIQQIVQQAANNLARHALYELSSSDNITVLIVLFSTLASSDGDVQGSSRGSRTPFVSTGRISTSAMKTPLR